MLNIFIEEPGQLVGPLELSKELGVSRQTLSEYLRYLEESFLIIKIYNSSKSRRKVERKLKKLYATVISPSLLFKEDELAKTKVFEWIIVNQLRAEFFWRDPYKNEVDIVIPGKKPVPIEIKYGKVDFKGLLAFMKKFKVDKGYIISNNEEETKEFNGKKIFVIPAFKFLLKYKNHNGF